MKNWLDKMERRFATASYLFYTGTGTDFERAGVATSKLGDHPAE